MNGPDEGNHLGALVYVKDGSPRGHSFFQHAIGNDIKQIRIRVSVNPVVVGEVRANDPLSLNPVAWGAGCGVPGVSAAIYLDHLETESF